MAATFGTCSKCSNACPTSRSSTSEIDLPRYLTCNVSRLNRRPSHTGHVTHTSARKSISSLLAPFPSHASHRPPGRLKLNRPGW